MSEYRIEKCGQILSDEDIAAMKEKFLYESSGYNDLLKEALTEQLKLFKGKEKIAVRKVQNESSRSKLDRKLNGDDDIK